MGSAGASSIADRRQRRRRRPALQRGQPDPHPEGGGDDNTTDLYHVVFPFPGRSTFSAASAARTSPSARTCWHRGGAARVAITLVADVARAYVELRDLDRRLEISLRTLESRREYVALARDRFEGGSRPSSTSASRGRAAPRAGLRPRHREARAQKENEISYLLGRTRRPSPAAGGGPATDPAASAVGLPAALLERRPDLREAEQRLISANALIGEAKAQLYPRISLTGSYGFASTDLGDLLEGSSQSWKLPGRPGAADLQRGQAPRRVEMRSRSSASGLRVRADAAAGVARGRGFARRLQKAGEQRDAQGLRSSRSAGARVVGAALSGGVAAYSKCSTRSARCSTPRSTRFRASAGRSRR